MPDSLAVQLETTEARFSELRRQIEHEFGSDHRINIEAEGVAEALQRLKRAIAEHRKTAQNPLYRQKRRLG